jgi:hypothetical protein
MVTNMADDFVITAIQGEDNTNYFPIPADNLEAFPAPARVGAR